MESVRGFAATYVVAGHICNVYFHNPAWAFPFRFSAEAVVLFFLLSGFVVRLSTQDDTTAKDFFLKRIKRIYPLFVLSLGFSYLLASASAQDWAPVLGAKLLGNLLMLQDFGYARPGVWVEQYYNEALWSLAYEWWFYVFFIVSLKWCGSPFLRNLCVLAAAALALVGHSIAPNQVSYFVVNFVIWWAAAEVARHYMQSGRIEVKNIWPWCVALLALGACWLPFVIGMPAQNRSLGLYPILDLRRFIAGALFLALGLFWYKRWHQGGSALFQCTLGPFKRVAPISYGIYILHFPIIEYFVSTKLAARPLVCVPVILLCVLIVAYVAEIRIQGWVNSWSIWGGRKWRESAVPAMARPELSQG